MALATFGMTNFCGAADGPVLVQQAAPQGDFVIENDFVRAVVSPAQGGAITEVRYKKALALPQIVERGGGIAATGKYFIDIAAPSPAPKSAPSGAEWFVSLGDTAYRADVLDKGPDQAKVKLVADAARIAPGFAVERIVTLARSESALRITQTFTNNGLQVISFQPGSRFEQRAEPWRTDLRLWLGDSRSHRWLFGPYNQDKDGKKGPEVLKTQNPEVQWQTLSQYGVGLIARTGTLAGPVQCAAHYPPGEGVPLNVHWLAPMVNLEPGKSISIETFILVQEGMREIMTLTGEGMAATAYAQTCADPGEKFPVFGVLVSATRRTVDAVLEQNLPNKPRQVIATRSIMLEPGKAVEFRGEASSSEKGSLALTCSALEQGKVLCAGGARTWVLDGPGGDQDEPAQVRKRYMLKLPEFHYQGSWMEIGRQMAEKGQLKKPGTPRANAAQALAFYRQHFPYYADMLAGAAQYYNVPVEQMVAAEFPEPASATSVTACMAVYFNGPDGPMIGFSKERSSSSIGGLTYVKIKPDKGYRFHYYLGNYGVNEAGLATGGATIVTDKATEDAGNQMTREWRAAGKFTAPMGGPMLLATCATVEEAIRFIENPNAPMDFTGNMLIVDKEGNAAVLQSQGIMHHIRRYTGPKDRMDPDAYVFTATNYAHPNERGLFKPGAETAQKWQWHYNALIREWRVGQFVRELGGQVSLKDLFWIMRTQNQPGGVAQHIWDNVGRLYTTTSFIAVTRTGDLYLTAGSPWYVHYERYRLAD